MSRTNWEKSNNRKSSGRFLALPASVLNCANFIKLSAYGVKLIVDLGEQYNGKNNGDLCATWSLMVKKGWKSRSTLNHSLNELMHYRFIVKTRQGGQHAPSLYGLTWQKIDQCGGKLDIKPTEAPLGWWMVEQPRYVSATNKSRNTHIEHNHTHSESIGSM